MNNLRKAVAIAASFAVLAACAKTTDTAADQAAVRAVQDSWYKAYNGGDGAAIAALYADDAVLDPPNGPAARGIGIHEYFMQDAAEFAASGSTATQGASDVGVSGDLAWQGGTYQITNKSGAIAATGEFLTVFRRTDGKWMIIRDTWNPDPTPVAQTEAPPRQAL